MQREEWETKQENLSLKYKVKRDEEIQPILDQCDEMERRLQELRDYRLELQGRLSKLEALDYEKRYREEINQLQRELEEVKRQRAHQAKEFDASMEDMQE